MRFTPYQSCPGLDLAWAGPLTTYSLACRYGVEECSVRWAAAEMGLPDARPRETLRAHRYYRAFMDRALIADLHFQNRLRALTDEESEMLVAAVAREKQRGHVAAAKRRARRDPERRERELKASRDWQVNNRERNNASRRDWYARNAADQSAKERRRRAARVQR